MDATAVARGLGVKEKFRNLAGGRVRFLPMRVFVLAQGATASNASYEETKRQVFSAREVGDTVGYGSPAHLAMRELLPANGDGVGTIPVTLCPLKDHATGVAAAGDITPSGTATKEHQVRFKVSGILSEPITIAVGAVSVATIIADAIAAINAVLEMPVIPADGTTQLDLTAKWAGPTGNDIKVEVVGPSLGVTWTITQPTGGATNPSITSALAQIGNVWETFLLNCLDVADTTVLDEIKTLGEGRWGELVRKPFVAFVGNSEASVTTATTGTDARKDDRINAQLTAPGSPNLPCVIAARQLARIAVVAQNNPPTDYGAQRATGLEPGTDGEQWTYTQRDTAVKAGSSTVEVVDGVVKVSDAVTMYHPTGEEPPAYRYVVDIVKLMNIIYNVDLIFQSEEWAAAPLIPNDQPTVNPNAKKPKDAIGAVHGLLDNLGLQAIISDPKTAKVNTTATIDTGNPKRLNVGTVVQLSGNTNTKDVSLNWGFFFGG